MDERDDPFFRSGEDTAEPANRWGYLSEELAEKFGLRGLPSLKTLCISVVVLAALALGLWYWLRSDPLDTAAKQSVVQQSADNGALEQSQEETGSIIVQVVGAVKQPGVYELARGSRGIDAVKCAGGLKAEASPDAVNLAAELSDGSQLRLPTKKEAKRSAQQAEGAVASGGQSSSSSEAGAAINLNSADAAALQTLPGIGPVTAEKIIAEREKSGAFTSLDDLQRVAGIGQKRVEALRGLADVR